MKAFEDKARAYAAENIKSDDLDIDPNATVSIAEGSDGIEGAWVAAWVWVPAEALEAVPA